ncbi:glycosyltransferase [Limosilactobacillus mucosae]|uniref:Glycosyltransferase n=1 Tax=Limosilactobacillus mucosae TaxID=97478 RepID=A0AAJ1HPD9_LIMMU|nr:glycosyltransferase [Limosilactobacillus mucosae]MDC2827027.1 glycosyltransferase [Limosilactobacillus mucosae]MDC2835120.1 glycosyltransferase [Limosilactobacillus mucosae]
MIPKIIHYIWFGGDKNPIVLKAIKTWKKNAPDYEIKEWNEKDFSEEKNEFFRNALKKQDYAFASDYARLLILKKYGGLYLDTDMFLLKNPTSKIVGRDLAFSIQDPQVIFSTSFIAAKPEQEFIRKALVLYQKIEYVNGKMVPNTELLSPLLTSMYNFESVDKTQVRMNGKIIAYNSNVFLQPSFSSVAMHVGEKSWSTHTKHDDIRIKMRQNITTSTEAGIFRIINDMCRRFI